MWVKTHSLFPTSVRVLRTQNSKLSTSLLSPLPCQEPPTPYSLFLKIGVTMKLITLSRQGKIGVVFVLGAALFFTLGILAKPNPQDFVDARIVAPAPLIKKAISENYLSPNGSDIQPKALKLSDQKDLYIFDFNTDELCGTSGCLYVVYTGKAQRVLSVYLQNNLPKTIKLFVPDGKQNGYSCLGIAQVNPVNKEVIQTRYCYQAGTLIPVFEQLLEVKS